MTNEWKPSKHYKRVVGANKQAYERVAHIYDENETCVVSERLQKVLAKDLDSILARIKKSGNKKSTSEIHVLDACGGSGNVSLKLLEKKVNVTLCDISPELIKLFKDKCLDRGYTNYSTICQEIGEYLSKTTENFDLIVFSSALHHIEDYSSVLLLAANQLNTNGFIYTIFDNVKWQFPAFQIVWIDSILHALTKYPREFISAQIKKWKKDYKEGAFTERELASLTEYHFRTGIDDYQLIDFLNNNNLNVLLHERYYDARHKLFRLLLFMVRRPTGFKLLLTKNHS